MPEPAIRADVVALLIDLQLDTDTPPNMWTHMDGRPITPAELDLAMSATRAELTACADYYRRAADHAASCDERIQARIQAAKQRRVLQQNTRAAFAQNRAAGIRARHALREARARLTARHTLPPANPAGDPTKENTVNDLDRDQLAQDTAEYIANVLTPQAQKTHALPGVTVHYINDQRPPTDVPGIKAALLDGRVWISWICDRVTQAMRQLHGEPTGDATDLIDD